tara:strand:- start:443 stop:691 length:249 start_codon:yes stop_codon:yes gene_type:complete
MAMCIAPHVHAKCQAKGSLILKMSEAKKQCYHEFKNMIHRWSEESDLDDEEIVQCMVDAAKEYYDQDVVEFECDMDLEEDDE